MNKNYTLILFLLVLSACSSQKGEPEPETESVTKITLVSPADGSTITAAGDHRFTWTATNSKNEKNIPIKIKITEVLTDQTPENALRTNKPIFEKDSCCNLTVTSITHRNTAAGGIAPEKKYAWRILTKATVTHPKVDSSAVSTFFAE